MQRFELLVAPLDVVMLVLVGAIEPCLELQAARSCQIFLAHWTVAITAAAVAFRGGTFH
jgi:hypothetical protein